MTIVYTVFSNKREAQKIINTLIKDKLIACANFWPIESHYVWKGKKEEAREYACFIKTLKKNYKKVEKFILKNHSYDTPCILEIGIKKSYAGYDKYLEGLIV